MSDAASSASLSVICPCYIYAASGMPTAQSAGTNVGSAIQFSILLFADNNCPAEWTTWPGHSWQKAIALHSILLSIPRQLVGCVHNLGGMPCDSDPSAGVSLSVGMLITNIGHVWTNIYPAEGNSTA